MLRYLTVCVLFSLAYTDKSVPSDILNVTNVNESSGSQFKINQRTRSDRFMGRGSVSRFSNNHNSDVFNNGNNSSIYGNPDELIDCQLDSSFITCVKLILLRKVSDTLKLIQEYDKRDMKFEIMNDLLSFENINDKWKMDNINTYQNFIGFKEDDEGEKSELDLLLASEITKLFQNRSLKVNFIPGLSMRILPSADRSNLINLSLRYCFDRNNSNELINTEHGVQRRKDNDFLKPWMLIPAAVMVGMFPYTLLKLKMLVTSAMTFNNMVLMGALWMTMRNLVFGTRPGGIVVYNNLGYKNQAKPLPHYPGHQTMTYYKNMHKPHLGSGDMHDIVPTSANLNEHSYHDHAGSPSEFTESQVTYLDENQFPQNQGPLQSEEHALLPMASESYGYDYNYRRKGNNKRRTHHYTESSTRSYEERGR